MIGPDSRRLLSYVRRFAPSYGFPNVPPALILAQAVLETGDFTSSIFEENRNYFGLKEPSIRPTKATGTNRNHATFATLSDCVRDYFLRQAYFNIPDTSDPWEYMAATKSSGYATATNYVQAWSRIFEDIEGPVMAYERRRTLQQLLGGSFLTFGLVWNAKA